eukprot:jgi/Mesvir1/29064/Mv18372-RA.1
MDAWRWSKEDVLRWLVSLGPQASAYAQFFDRHEVDGACLLECSNEELRDELQVAPLGHRRLLRRAIEQLRAASLRPHGYPPDLGWGPPNSCPAVVPPQPGTVPKDTYCSPGAYSDPAVLHGCSNTSHSQRSPSEYRDLNSGDFARGLPVGPAAGSASTKPPNGPSCRRAFGDDSHDYFRGDGEPGMRLALCAADRHSHSACQSACHGACPAQTSENRHCACNQPAPGYWHSTQVHPTQPYAPDHARRYSDQVHLFSDQPYGCHSDRHGDIRWNGGDGPREAGSCARLPCSAASAQSCTARPAPWVSAQSYAEADWSPPCNPACPPSLGGPCADAVAHNSGHTEVDVGRRVLFHPGQEACTNGGVDDQGAGRLNLGRRRGYPGICGDRNDVNGAGAEHAARHQGVDGSVTFGLVMDASAAMAGELPRPSDPPVIAMDAHGTVALKAAAETGKPSETALSSSMSSLLSPLASPPASSLVPLSMSSSSSLSLRFVPLQPDAERFARGLEQSAAALASVTLQDNRISPEQCAKLIKALSRHPHGPTLRSLSLLDNHVGDVGATMLARILHELPSLTELHLVRCLIGPQGVSTLAPALPGCPLLKSLSLEGNVLGTEGSRDLGACLARCSSLEDLHLAGTSLGTKGVAGLAPYLPSAPLLAKLDLRNVYRASVGVDDASGALIWALRDCAALSSLDLSQNGFCDEACAQIIGALAAKSRRCGANHTARADEDETFTTDGEGSGVSDREEGGGSCRESLRGGCRETLVEVGSRNMHSNGSEILGDLGSRNNQGEERGPQVGSRPEGERCLPGRGGHDAHALPSNETAAGVPLPGASRSVPPSSGQRPAVPLCPLPSSGPPSCGPLPSSGPPSGVPSSGPASSLPCLPGSERGSSPLYSRVVPGRPWHPLRVLAMGGNELGSLSARTLGAALACGASSVGGGKGKGASMRRRGENLPPKPDATTPLTRTMTVVDNGSSLVPGDAAGCTHMGNDATAPSATGAGSCNVSKPNAVVHGGSCASVDSSTQAVVEMPQDGTEGTALPQHGGGGGDGSDGGGGDGSDGGGGGGDGSESSCLPLASLHIPGCNLQQWGARALAYGIRLSRALTELDVKSNNIQDARLLVEAFKASASLRHADISYNGLPFGQVEELRDIHRKHPKLSINL